MSDWLHDAQQHYSGTLCEHEGEVWSVKAIDYPVFENPSDYEKYRHQLPKQVYEAALVGFIFKIRPLGVGNSAQDKKVTFDRLKFTFPVPKVINVQDQGFPKVVMISRYATKQYRRGLRADVLTKTPSNYSLNRKLGQQASDGISNAELKEFFNPKYYSYKEAKTLLSQLPGTCAISENFWIGTSPKFGELVFGYNQYTVGILDPLTDHLILDRGAGELIQLIQEEVDINVAVE